MKTIELKAYAKINLSLDVLNKRQDGYHNIETIFHQVELFDTLQIIVDFGGSKDSWQNVGIELSMSGKDSYLAFIPDNEENIAVKAIRLFLKFYQPDSVSGIKINICKNIPPLAGLGGGSADAAAVLLGLARIFKITKPDFLNTLAMRSIEIGADVPFCFFGQAALNPDLGYKEIIGSSTCAFGEETGGLLKWLPPLKAWALLVKPSVALSTKIIYENLNLKNISKRPNTMSIIGGLKKNDYEAVINSMVNVLEIPALIEYPKIKQIKSQIVLSGADVALMSGSGSTVLGLFRGEDLCRSAALTLLELLPDCEIMPVALI
jgi:4-diphosphocytidyl-2-C-methyl-D-erythritol kinase